MPHLALSIVTNGNFMIILLAVGGGLAAVLAVATGRWRVVLAPFRINPRRMTVARLGLAVRDPRNVERVDSVLRSFLSGFNETLTGKSLSNAFQACDKAPVLLRPFAQEGLAMGYTPRFLFRYDAESFERLVVRAHPEYRYLYYVGLGFWSGMRNHAARDVTRIAERLDALHRFLVFDGYGFKVAFFDAPRSDSAFSRLSAFDGYARNAAWQGVGRALYFRFMDDPDSMIGQVRACGTHAEDAAAGIGLAAVFVNPDRLKRAFELAEKMPVEWWPHVHLGMCFGLKARSINDIDQFDADLSRLDGSVQVAIRSSIRECDRVELLVRSESRKDGYESWRQRVAQWMNDRIEYPLRGMRSAGDRERKGHRGDEGIVSGLDSEIRKGVPS